MKKIQGHLIPFFASCMVLGLVVGCAGPKGFSVYVPEKPLIDYTGVPYDEAWKDLVAFMEGDAKWCMGTIEDMSKTDGYVRTSWRTSNNMITPFQTRVMARFNDARDHVEFTPEAMFQTVPGYSTEVTDHLKVAIRLHDAKKKRQLAEQQSERVNKKLAEAPAERKLPQETEADKATALRLVGVWKSETTGEITTQYSGQKSEKTTWQDETTYDVHADGTISETSKTLTSGKTIPGAAKGTWAVRGDRFYYRRELKGPKGPIIGDCAMIMIWKDADHWEMRDDPTDEIANARKKELGDNTQISYDADGTQRTLTINNGLRIECVSTQNIFKRCASVNP